MEHHNSQLHHSMLLTIASGSRIMLKPRNYNFIPRVTGQIANYMTKIYADAGLVSVDKYSFNLNTKVLWC